MIALIAGTGQLPLRACSTLIEQNTSFMVVSLFPENNGQALAAVCDGHAEVLQKPYYKPSSIIAAVKSRGCNKLFFIGKVDKGALLKHISFDSMALSFFAKLTFKGDRDIMQGAINFLEDQGFSVLQQDEVLGGLFCKPGIICGELSEEDKKSIFFGLQKAREISAADIGQTVVVKDCMVIAAEAIEGTDACLQRAIALAQGGVILCKTAFKDHNRKYDLPTLGPATLAVLQAGDVKAIAWEAHTTLINDLELFKQKAQELNICLIAVE